MKFSWANKPLEVQFDLFHNLVKRGWRIELESIDQEDNGTWNVDKETGLPIPNQSINRFGDIPLMTWTTYVYSPKSEDWIEELNASFDSPLQAYEWLAPRLEKYVNEKRWNQ
ncbi:MAG: hypothetical protein K2O77_04280 [Limosilactobacillus sp.]|uniref:hypothetical protein n=1 Tax=Limosilactobacillus TaxID=2742598 RepID=UPI00138EEEA0|nr:MULTISPECIES: hypothetical protein [Limosilactobacillus]MDE7040162.1 hypothetical protein [Limosilactobacillus sp.]NDO57227.1 hypothetical protein [Limosilactobacillus reuteri]